MTTMIQIVTAGAIILASDSKMADDSAKDLGVVDKIVTLSKTTAIANCDAAKIDATVIDSRTFPFREYQFKYDFLSWANQFAGISNPVLVTAAVASAARGTFSNFGLLIQAKAFKQRATLATYYVAGYTEQAAPVINKITIALDWANAVVREPQIESAHPVPGQDPFWGFRTGCTHEIIDRVLRKDGAPYQRARELESALLDKLLSAQDLKVDEAKRLAGALITVESEFNPSYVGLPVRFVVIDKPVLH